MVERNKAPYGNLGNFLFGLSTLIDGLIRVISFGFLHGTHRFTPLSVSRFLTKRHFKKLKEKYNG